MAMKRKWQPENVRILNSENRDQFSTVIWNTLSKNVPTPIILPIILFPQGFHQCCANVQQTHVLFNTSGVGSPICSVGHHFAILFSKKQFVQQFVQQIIFEFAFCSANICFCSGFRPPFVHFCSVNTCFCSANLLWCSPICYFAISVTNIL